MTSPAHTSKPRRGRQLTDFQFRAVVAVVASVIALGMISLRFCGDVSLPPPIPKPEPPARSASEVSAAIEASPMAYRGYIDNDAEAYRVGAVTVEDMAAVLPYRVDETRYTLAPDDGQNSIETAGLRLTLSTQRIEGEVRPLMVLAIENTGERDLAYNIVTRPSRGPQVCATKKNLVYNAMVVRAGETQTRSECSWRSGWKLEIHKVETVALPPLSYHYVSKVPPQSIGMEARLARGHVSPDGRTCNVLLPATVRSALDDGRTTWRDLIDFFARHRCETYQFPQQYKAFSKDREHTLPAVSE